MKKYLVPALFTIAILALVIFAVRAVSSTANYAKPADSQSPSVTVSDSNKSALAKGQTFGKKDSKIVLTEFADFQCPACKFYETTLRELKEEYKDQVLFVFKHYPLYPQPHKNAQIASIASEAASKQGKFWEMHDKLYDTQEDWAELEDPKSKFNDYADGLGLDLNRFKSDVAAEAGKDAIAADKEFGTRLKLKGTPSFFLNGAVFDTTGDPSALKDAVKKAVDAK